MTVSNNLNINDDGLQDFDATTGDFTAIALTTKGDLLGYDGSSYQRFPVGTEGYVLKADSSETLGWRWACTNFEFLDSATASSSSSIEFNNFADGECFAGYKLIWKNVRFSGGNVDINLRFSIDNGSTWLTTDYKYVRNTVRDDTADEVFPADDAATYIQLNAHTGDSASSIIHNGEGFFYPGANPGTTLQNSFVYTSAGVSNNSQFITSRGFGINSTTSQVDGFQFRKSSGNIVSGTFYLYGVLQE